MSHIFALLPSNVRHDSVLYFRTVSLSSLFLPAALLLSPPAVVLLTLSHRNRQKERQRVGGGGGGQCARLCTVSKTAVC